MTAADSSTAGQHVEPVIGGSGPHDPARDETVEARLARWIARDEEIGLAAQRDELRRRLAERDREIADLRERLAHLSNTVGQLRSQPTPQVARASFGQRLYRKLRRTVGGVLRS